MYSNYDCLSFYDGGVVTDHHCQCSDPNENDVNHAITIVGYGRSEHHGCKDYWIIRNSWGYFHNVDRVFVLCRTVRYNNRRRSSSRQIRRINFPE